MSHRETFKRASLLGFGAGVLAWGVSNPSAYLELLLTSIGGSFIMVLALALAEFLINLIFD